MKICVFAGTTEGRRLVEFLSAQDCLVTACVATDYGRTLLTPKEGLTILEKRLDSDEMAALFRREEFGLVVDATHPYAAVVTENIVKACDRTGTRYLRLLREESEEVDGAVYAEDTEKAVEFLNTVSGNILLTTGSKELPKYAGIKDFENRVYVRLLPMQSSLDACEKAGVKVSHIIAMQGPFSEKMNEAMIESTQARYLVTKDGGSTGGFAEKAMAAKKAGIRMVIIGRPVQMQGLSFEEVINLFVKEFGYRAEPESCAALPGEDVKETGSAVFGEDAKETGSAGICREPKETGGAVFGEDAKETGSITIVGIGPGSRSAMTDEVKEAIASADCLIGAKRMIEAVKQPGQPSFEAVAPGRIVDAISRHPQYSRFTVVMSGDSGFFSGTKKLLLALEEKTTKKVTVLPGLSSLSCFCARLGLSYENVKTVSVHGRRYSIIGDVRENELVFVLTGGDADIKEICRELINAGLDTVKVHVAARLSYPDERIVSGAPEELLKESFDKLSVVLVENPSPAKAFGFGLPDASFIRGEGKKGIIPMTKSEIRAVCLSKLALTDRAVCWDIGAGTGSVSVEMALAARKGAVYAVEKNEDAVALLYRNKEKFMTDNLFIIQGTAPEAAGDLPAPTHVFIGGSSGNIRPVIELALSKNPKARIVATAVTLESTAELANLMKEFETAEAVCVNVSADRKAGPYHLMTAQNPITIFTLQP